MTEAERWLAQAERDLDDARFAASGSRWNLACFLSQQAAEKALKAYLYASGAESVRGHSVAELCRDAAGRDAAFGELGADASALDQYYIPTRYPNGLPGGIPADAYTHIDGERALSLSTAVIDLVRAMLPTAPKHR
jgi:HEPN domain-containing protein